MDQCALLFAKGQILESRDGKELVFNRHLLLKFSVRSAPSDGVCWVPFHFQNSVSEFDISGVNVGDEDAEGLEIGQDLFDDRPVFIECFRIHGAIEAILFQFEVCAPLAVFAAGLFQAPRFSVEAF
jgi:hypothetical protein